MPRAKYRKKLADGTKPEGKQSWCVHCDGSCEDKKCSYPECDCNCHKFPRKLTCLCRKGILKCCCGCDCKCHKRDWKLYEQNRETRNRLRKRWQDRLEKKRFALEGVVDWEKETLKYVMINQTNLDAKFSRFIWAMNKENEIKETGTEFMARMKSTSWGKEYIDNHSPVEKGKTK